MKRCPNCSHIFDDTNNFCLNDRAPLIWERVQPNIAGLQASGEHAHSICSEAAGFTGHALIVVEGNFETDQPSQAQMESLLQLAAWLAIRNNVSAANIKAHNDYASTACPGSNLKLLLQKFRENVGVILNRDNEDKG